MMQVNVTHAKVEVATSFSRQGSVLAETIETHCEGVTTKLDIASDDPPERVAALIRNAEKGCYTMSALRQPVAVATTAELNGAPFDFTSHKD